MGEAPGIGALGAAWDAVFAAGPGLQMGRAWFRATEAAAVPEGARPLWLTLEVDGAAAGLLPLLRLPNGTVSSLTSPYSLLYQPLLGTGVNPFAAGIAFGRALRRWPVVRLEALDPGWAGLAGMLAGMRRAGLVSLRFAHFGNWHETVEEGWEAYVDSRPPVLRTTIRRRLRAAEKAGELRHEFIRAPGEVGAALAAYEAVYARSWKEPEPYGAFNRALLPSLAEAGVLRMAVLWRGERPIAAQYWTVEREVGTVLKLAHDEAEKAVSPGTVLTAVVIRSLLAEGVRALDFGRGDDAYKRGWVGLRRERVGVALVTPWRAQGALALARHAGGMVRRRIRGMRGVTGGS